MPLSKSGFVALRAWFISGGVLVMLNTYWVHESSSVTYLCLQTLPCPSTLSATKALLLYSVTYLLVGPMHVVAIRMNSCV